MSLLPLQCEWPITVIHINMGHENNLTQSYTQQACQHGLRKDCSSGGHWSGQASSPWPPPRPHSWCPPDPLHTPETAHSAHTLWRAGQGERGRRETRREGKGSIKISHPATLARYRRGGLVCCVVWGGSDEYIVNSCRHIIRYLLCLQRLSAEMDFGIKMNSS